MLNKYQVISGEISGSMGDLGTFLPYIIGIIVIGGLDATGVLLCFGLMYIFTGWFYRIPMPVQPMKIVGAAVLVHSLTAGEVAAAGIMISISLLFLGLTGLVDKLARLTPPSVTYGIQAGLGISLSLLGIKYIQTDLLIGVTILLLMLFLFQNKILPASIVGVIGGTLLSFILNPSMHWPNLTLGFHLPHLILPAWTDFSRGFSLAFLPQLPLTLTNSVLITAALAHELYPEKSKHVSEKNLCLSLGIGNLIAMPLGGFVMCHGSGGLAAHHRFGGRTGFTPIIIGVFLLLTAIFLGPAGVDLLEVIPQSVLGGLLFYSGVDLIGGIRGIDGRESWFTFSIVLICSIAVNPALAFGVGLFIALLFSRGWIRI